jgi:CheY-like chemotaxis protein
MKTLDIVNSVVLIDDDSTFNFINHSILQSLSFAKKIITFENPDKAIEGLREIASEDESEFPEMIFLDINMPAKDGWDFLDEYKRLPESLKANCRVVMLTSSISEHDMAKAREYNVIHDFVSKPLTPEKLVLLMDGLTAIV